MHRAIGTRSSRLQSIQLEFGIPINLFTDSMGRYTCAQYLQCQAPVSRYPGFFFVRLQENNIHMHGILYILSKPSFISYNLTYILPIRIIFVATFVQIFFGDTQNNYNFFFCHNYFETFLYHIFPSGQIIRQQTFQNCQDLKNQACLAGLVLQTCSFAGRTLVLSSQCAT